MNKNLDAKIWIPYIWRKGLILETLRNLVILHQRYGSAILKIRTNDLKSTEKIRPVRISQNYLVVIKIKSVVNRTIAKTILLCFLVHLTTII